MSEAHEFITLLEKENEVLKKAIKAVPLIHSMECFGPSCNCWVKKIKRVLPK
jgi:hypothetical protein